MSDSAKILKTLEGSVRFGREAADDLVLHHPSPWSQDEFDQIVATVEKGFVDPFEREGIGRELYAPFVKTALTSFRQRVDELVPDISLPPPGFERRDPLAEQRRNAATIARECADREFSQRRPPWPKKYLDKVEQRYLRAVLQPHANSEITRDALDAIVEAASEAFDQRIKELDTA
jgi:hypothetical protein